MTQRKRGFLFILTAAAACVALLAVQRTYAEHDAPLAAEPSRQGKPAPAHVATSVAVRALGVSAPQAERHDAGLAELAQATNELPAPGSSTGHPPLEADWDDVPGVVRVMPEQPLAELTAAPDARRGTGDPLEHARSTHSTTAVEAHANGGEDEVHSPIPDCGD